MEKPDAVLFDLDGTLADTIPLIVASWNAAVGPVVGRSFTQAEVLARFGVPDDEMIRREVPEQWEAVAAAYFAHYERAHGAVEVFDGVRELLAAVRARGLPMGIMTGKGRRAADLSLRALGWDATFDAVVTGDEARRSKPAPDGLIQVAAMVGARPGRCVWVGDSPADMRAGRAAGMTTIAAGWHSVYAEQIRALGPDGWADHPSDVLRWVGA